MITIPSKERATVVEDAWYGKELGAMVPSEEIITRKSNRIVHNIRCYAIRVLGLSKRVNFIRSTLDEKSSQWENTSNPLPTDHPRPLEVSPPTERHPSCSLSTPNFVLIGYYLLFALQTYVLFII